MSLTFEQAEDEMLTMLNTAWLTTGYDMFWEDVRDQRSADSDPWASTYLRHTFSNQSTLGGQGNRSFTRIGMITVQIFTPIGKGLSESRMLAKVVSDTFEGKASPGGVWFKNVRPKEVGRDGEFYQIDVLIEFSYDEVK